jgi:DNA-directed RNA polymerase delta subunit
MKLTEKKITLREFVDRYFPNGEPIPGFHTMIMRLYVGVRDFDRVLEIDEKVITPINKIKSAHDKVLTAFREQAQKEIDNKDALQKIEDEYQKSLDREVKFNVAHVTKDEAKAANFNVHELQVVKEFIDL